MTISDLENRVKSLEEELENKQIEVEETDDRYLGSLKTIKKQEIALDKLKVRIEALQRANVLLTKAVPASTPDVLAPQPASAKKRGLPQEFVAPDPGPRAIVTTVQALKENISPTKVISRDQENNVLPRTEATSLKSLEKPIKPLPATASAAPYSKPRRPLSSVSAQPVAPLIPNLPSKPVQQTISAVEPPKLNARSGLKTTSLSTTARTMSARTGGQDTKSLLAALQALKKNTV